MDVLIAPTPTAGTVLMLELWHSLLLRLPFDWAQFGFMQNALLAIIIVTPLFALIGCLVIHSQMAFFSDAIGHAGLTGIALGILMGFADPTFAIIIFGCLLAIIITALRRISHNSIDTIIGLVMSSTIALGVLLLSRGGGFARYSNFLIGDILSINSQELVRLLVVMIIVLVIWVLAFNSIFLLSVNSTLARSRRIPPFLIESFFAILIAAVVSVCIQWVGILVINALLLLPAGCARNVATSMKSYTLYAIAAGLISGVSGLICSFYWSTATGATIVLCSLVLYCISLPIGYFIRRS